MDGFQDHAIGPILGCSGNTGAGGANVWSHELLCQFAAWPGSPFRPLPIDVGMNVSIRRNLRVGARSGTPLEDLGVASDEIHRMTSRDVLGSNEDLIDHAAGLLADRKPYRLAVAIGRQQDDVELTLTTRNLVRVDAYVDEHPACSISVKDGETPLSVQVPSGDRRLELKGFDADGTLAAARKEEL